MRSLFQAEMANTVFMIFFKCGKREVLTQTRQGQSEHSNAKKRPGKEKKDSFLLLGREIVTKKFQKATFALLSPYPHLGFPRAKLQRGGGEQLYVR